MLRLCARPAHASTVTYLRIHQFCHPIVMYIVSEAYSCSMSFKSYRNMILWVHHLYSVTCSSYLLQVIQFCNWRTISLCNYMRILLMMWCSLASHQAHQPHPLGTLVVADGSGLGRIN